MSWINSFTPILLLCDSLEIQNLRRFFFSISFELSSKELLSTTILDSFYASTQEEVVAHTNNNELIEMFINSKKEKTKK